MSAGLSCAGAKTSTTEITFKTAVRKLDIKGIKNFSSVFKVDPVRQLEIENSEGGVFNQITTYSGNQFEEKSFKVEVPAHQWGDTAFEQLTVVMHSAAIGFWHNDFTYAEYSTPLKVNWI